MPPRQGCHMFKLFQKPFPFWLAMIVIAGISAFDSYMSAIAGASLGPLELNPMAKYLINLDGGRVALLVGCKTFGTAFAMLVCASMRHARYKHMGVVIWALILVQIGVLCSYIPFLFVR
jgi:hypothetical protein